jgi:hypothetical protein
MTASLAGPEPDGERTSSVQDDGPAMRQVGPSHKPLSSGIAPQATDIGVPDREPSHCACPPPCSVQQASSAIETVLAVECCAMSDKKENRKRAEKKCNEPLTC